MGQDKRVREGQGTCHLQRNEAGSRLQRGGTAPGKRTLTMSLPQCGATVPGTVQRKPEASTEPSPGTAKGPVEDWTNVVFRPDLYQEPIQRNNAGDVGTLTMRSDVRSGAGSRRQEVPPVQLKPVYRGMIDAGGKPALGESARKLGVRVGPDLDVVDGVAKHNQKGMSTSPDNPENLPKHRRPKEFGGTGRDPVWEADSSELTNETIEWHQDGPTHGIVRPTEDMPYDGFKAALEATQDRWSKKEP